MYVRKTGKAMQGMWKNSECGKTGKSQKANEWTSVYL